MTWADYHQKLPDTRPAGERSLLWRIFLRCVAAAAWLMAVCGLKGAVGSYVWNETTDLYIVVKDAATTSVHSVVLPGQTAYIETGSGASFQVRQLSDNGYVGGYDDSSGTYLRLNPDGTFTTADPAYARPLSAGTGGTVHVDNPVQGMEFVIFSLGFLCAAVIWRFLMGRW